MSVFHYKGELVEIDGDHLVYRFNPDTVSKVERWGELRVAADLGGFEITRSSGLGSRNGVSADERCARALIHKLRRSDDIAPETLEFVA